MSALETCVQALPHELTYHCDATMSERLLPPNPADGSFHQFQVTVQKASNQQSRPSRGDVVINKLDGIVPKTEEQWSVTRQHNNFETPEDVHRVVSALVHDGHLSQELRKLIYIAVCCVDHSENEAEAYHKYRTRVQANGLTELTIRNYMSTVRGIVKLLDELFLVFGYRAFEAFLLYGQSETPSFML